MRPRRHIALAFLLMLTCLPGIARAGDTCLMFAASNIAKGGGNFYIYRAFSEQKIDFAAGDVMEYDIYLYPKNPQPVGGVDVDTTDGGFLRDAASAVDQNKLRAHGDTQLDRAKGKWYHRKIPLDALKGKQAARWNVVSEGDAQGVYVQFIDNVLVRRGDGSKIAIEPDRKLFDSGHVMKEGYSQYMLVKNVDRSSITDGADLGKFVDREMGALGVKLKLDTLRSEIELARKMANRSGDSHAKQHVAEAEQLIKRVEVMQSPDAETLQSLIHQVHESLNHEHPEMRKYTGHLVGHAHIDFQWLWEWPETVQVCHDTFSQAIKFMDEFKGAHFTFSQSSAALYAATEEHFPELFKRMQEKVAEGQWEIVGGRVCEGDEHMISPESHARHFLYGQRYFRERFNGRDAIVGWEPDTFGHTWQFPQILKLAGCKYFYFCRGGHGKPLFWWQGLDGTRVLAFEEPATGGWYNGDVQMNRFDRLFNFTDATGSKEMLWVYGVGNHGGGPTRENIESALKMAKVPFLPNVKFSTATEFFKILQKQDLSKIPTVNTEMNTTNNSGFFGTYTTHSDMKRWNRDAEAITESAEAIAAFASRYGFDYPQKEFRRNWEEITWNHHHDTLPGTSIHPSYNKSEAMYKRTIESSRKIADEAMKFFAARVKTDGEGVLVYNPTSTTRGGMIGENLVENVPAYGYRFIKTADLHKPGGVEVARDGRTIENADFRLVFDASRGVVVSIHDKKRRQETLAPNGGTGNRLEIHWEKPNGMSAWTIGQIEKVEPLLSPVDVTVSDNGIAWDRTFQSTTIHQSIVMSPSGPPVFAMSTQWKELGGGDKLCPFLKVAFDITNGPVSTFTSQIPFGAIERPIDGVEVPALKWADLSAPNGFGAALINDSKHGYSAKDSTLRLSLIRSSYYPDARPNDRPQSAKWIFHPHAGDWRKANIVPEAEAFNHPLLSTPITTANPNGELPPQASMLSLDADNIIVTGVKRAEDDNDLVIRFYESQGRQTHVQPKLAFDISKVSTVNLIEDTLGEEKGLAVDLHPWEIRTLKISTKPSETAGAETGQPSGNGR